MENVNTKADGDKRKAGIDSHKADSLSKQKEGKGHWKDELASSSESAVCSVTRRYIRSALPIALSFTFSIVTTFTDYMCHNVGQG